MISRNLRIFSGVLLMLLISAVVYASLYKESVLPPLPTATLKPITTPQDIEPSNQSPTQETTDQNNTNTSSENSGGNLHSIKKLRNTSLPSGTYTTEGFLLQKLACPPDPSPGLSAPCPKDRIIISEAKRETDIYPLTERDLVVFVKEAKRFDVGKFYRLRVKKKGYTNSQGQQESTFELIDYEVGQENNRL
jgi:hypothetical protein